MVDWLTLLVLEWQLQLAHNLSRIFLNELINQCSSQSCKRIREPVGCYEALLPADIISFPYVCHLVLFPFERFILLVSGESTKRGFYIYDQNRRATADPELQKYIQKARSISEVTAESRVSNYSSLRQN